MVDILNSKISFLPISILHYLYLFKEKLQQQSVQNGTESLSTEEVSSLQACKSQKQLLFKIRYIEHQF